MRLLVGFLLSALALQAQGQAPGDAPSSRFFSAEDISSGAFVDHKIELRRQRAERAPHRIGGLDRFFMQLNPQDPVDRFLPGTPVLRNLLEIEKRNLLSGTADRRPWTDSYWPMYKGLSAARYADPAFAQLPTWKLAADFVRDRPVAKALAGKDSAALDNLSPSEKYDLLTGDTQGSLTAALWGRGRYFQQTKGSVSTWMGLCDGWTAAAMQMPEPTRTLRLPAPDGRLITFYPSDIKALATLLWGRGSFAQRQLGGMCDKRNPPTDLYGHILDQNCFDPDPAAWHMAVVSKLGAERKSFAFDVTYDYEIWNQPLYSYRYSYFNPQTLAHGTSLREAAIAPAAYLQDRFRAYRSPGTRSIVGVMMAVTYIAGAPATHSEGPVSLTATANYIYDLDLDADMNILGGEWYTNKHPDFLWNIEPQTRIVTAGDALLGGANWDGQGAVPASWLEAVRQSAAKEQPLTVIVERLVELSSH